MNRVFYVVPVYNEEKHLERCVRSLLNQSYEDNYIILIDDGSTDRSPLLCDRFAREYENIETIHKPNGGLSDARNAGLKRCFEMGDEKDYLVFVDSDDFLREDFTQKLVTVCRENNCQMAQCEKEKGNADTFVERRKKGNIEMADKRAALLGYRLKSQMGGKLYRLYLYEDVRFPVGMLNEDEFVGYRAVYRCENIAFSDEKLYYYYQHAGSIMDNIARKLKDNPHRYDWLYAYLDRMLFFEKQNEPEQVLRTCEKVCTDIILRYTEQMRLAKAERDAAVGKGEYIRTYRNFYKKMIKRRGIPWKRRLMYHVFYAVPYAATLAEKVVPLRK